MTGGAPERRCQDPRGGAAARPVPPPAARPDRDGTTAPRPLPGPEASAGHGTPRGRGRAGRRLARVVARAAYPGHRRHGGRAAARSRRRRPPTRHLRPCRPAGLWRRPPVRDDAPRRSRVPLRRPDVPESRHCVGPSASATLSPDRSRSLHEQPSQEASALVRGAVGGPPRRMRARGPRAKRRRSASPCLIDHVRRTLRACYATPAHARLFRPAGTAPSQAGPKGHQAASRTVW